MEALNSSEAKHEIMRLLADLQDYTKLRETERKLGSIPLEVLVPHLVMIVKQEIENPEETTPEMLGIIKLQAAIYLKNICRDKFKNKVVSFFKDGPRALELLKEVVQILVKSEDPRIAPQLAPTILNILEQINAEGALVVEIIGEIYTKGNNDPDNFVHKQIAIESIYEIISGYISNFEVFDQIKHLDYLWKKDYPACADALKEIMGDHDSSQKSVYVKKIFITMNKIILKVFQIFEKEHCLEFIKYLGDLRQEVLRLALASPDTQDGVTKEMDLKAIHSLQRLEIYCTDYIALEKKDLELYLKIAEYFFDVSFKLENLEILKKKFLFNPESTSIEKESYKLANLLAQGVRFHKNILENSMFWGDDIGFGDSNTESTHELATKLTEYYNVGKLEAICECLITGYLTLDKAELEEWEDDPMTFYYESQDQETTSLLKDASYELINTLRMRFPEFLKEYNLKVKELIQHTAIEPDSPDMISLLRQKEALYNFLQQGADLEDPNELEGIIPLIEAELKSKLVLNKVLKRRMIMILVAASYQLTQMSDKEKLVFFLNIVIEIFVNEQDACLKLTCLNFFYELFNDYSLVVETYVSYIPDIINHSHGLLIEISSPLESGEMHTKYPEACQQIFNLFALLAQKYPDIVNQYIGAHFVNTPELPVEIRRKLIPVIYQILAVLEDQNITQELTKFVSALLDDASSEFNDPIVKENALKLLHIYLRRLQNFKADGANPFVLRLSTFRLAEKVVEELDFEEDEMLNVLLILEGIHFSLPKADTSEVTAEVVQEVYSNVFRKWFETATITENSYMVQLACYFASTLMISHQSEQIKQVCVDVVQKVKEDIVRMLIGEPTTDLGPLVLNKKPDDHDLNFINGFITLFSAILLKDIRACSIQDISENPIEIQFVKILTTIGSEYLPQRDDLFNLDEDDYDDTELKYISIPFAVVYLFYCNSFAHQGNEVGSYADLELQKLCFNLLKRAVEFKGDLVEISGGIFICDPLKSLTKDADFALLIDIPSKKLCLSKTKRDFIFESFLEEGRLFESMCEAACENS